MTKLASGNPGAVQTWPDGTKYVGEVKDDRPNGHPDLLLRSVHRDPYLTLVVDHLALPNAHNMRLWDFYGGCGRANPSMGNHWRLP